MRGNEEGSREEKERERQKTDGKVGEGDSSEK